MDPQSALNTSLFLGESYGFWIQTGAIFLSAAAAAGALFYSGKQVKHLRQQNESNEKLARMRATIDLVLHENANEHLTECRKSFGIMTDNKEDFAKYACGDLTDHQEVNDVLFPVLNSYEFMAAGVRTGAFDEEIYKRMKKSIVIRDWKALSGYVMQLRAKEKRDAIYIEFECIAKKWEKEPPNSAD